MDAPLFAAAPLDALPVILVNVAVWALLIGTVLFWAGVIGRWRGGRRVLPYEPRRPVPWTGGDLATVLVFFLATMIASGGVVQRWFDGEQPQPGAAEQQADVEGKRDREEKDAGLLPEDRSPHIVLRLVAEGGVLLLLVSVVSVVVVAPLAEEFFFRLALLGWLEKIERRWRRQLGGRKSEVGDFAAGLAPRWSPLAPGDSQGEGGTGETPAAPSGTGTHKAMPVGVKYTHGVLPITLTSLLFAMLHYRSAAPPGDVDYLLAMQGVVVTNAVVGLLTLAFAVSLFRARHGVTLADLGIVPDRLRDDVRLGLLALLGTFLPVMAVQLLLKLYVFRDQLAPDPIPMFLLAIVLGLLYYRTHRLVPSITLHAGFNLVNLLLAVLATLGD
ncbi:MAG: type II CAAX prenyl endopeptidase Rce1 family protein [Pirellulales bacterium]